MEMFAEGFMQRKINEHSPAAYFRNRCAYFLHMKIAKYPARIPRRRRGKISSDHVKMRGNIRCGMQLGYFLQNHLTIVFHNRILTRAAN